MISKRTLTILLFSIVALTILGLFIYFGSDVTYEIKNMKVGDKPIK